MLRIHPYLHRKWEPNTDELNLYAKYLTNCIDTLEYIRKYYQISNIFSDPVYLCSSLIQWSKQNSVQTPWLEAIDYKCLMPLTIGNKQRYQSGMATIQPLRQLDENLSSLQVANVENSLNQRVNGKNIHINNEGIEVKAFMQC